MSPRADVPSVAAACTDLSRAAAEPLAGTAPPRAVPWLLLEHPGPWDDAAARMTSVPAAVRAETARQGIRLALVRRHGRRHVERPTVLLVRAGRDAGAVRRLHVDRLDEVAGLDLAALAAGCLPADGVPVAGPVLLACTNGRVDPCCARLGRPVAAALSEHHPSLVWESTHVGGCRFAGNLVALPHGLSFGRLTPEAALAAVAELRAGRLAVEHVRGWGGWPAPAQVADVHLRRTLGVTRLDGTELRSCEEAGERARVRLRVGQDAWTVDLVRRDAGPPAPAGHGRDRTVQLGGWHVVAAAGHDPAARRAAWTDGGVPSAATAADGPLVGRASEGPGAG